MNSPRFAYQTRQARIKREGSPYYPYTLPATAAGASADIFTQTQWPESRKYEPLDYLEIINNEANNDITIVINAQDSLYCPAGVIRKVIGRALWHIKITNNGAAVTTAGKVVLNLRREPQTIDQWAKRQS